MANSCRSAPFCDVAERYLDRSRLTPRDEQTSARRPATAGRAGQPEVENLAVHVRTRIEQDTAPAASDQRQPAPVALHEQILGGAGGDDDVALVPGRPGQAFERAGRPVVGEQLGIVDHDRYGAVRRRERVLEV